jgi:hypothetical protein
MAEETRLEHPNRDKAGSKAARAVTVLLLIATAVLVAVITIGGWKVLQGAQPLAVVYILLYALFAYYVAKWTRGVLPVVAALSILLAVIAAVSAPGWFARAKDGFRAPMIDANMLGLLTIILVPVSILLVAFAMRGFQQKWNVEVERRPDDYDDDDEFGEYDRTQPAGA